MALTETRKAWLSTKFFSGGVMGSAGLLNAILSDLNSTSDVSPTDIYWIFGALGSIYTPPMSSSPEYTAKVTAIVNGSTINALTDCLAGQVCDLTPKTIPLYGIVTNAGNDEEAAAWLDLRLPVGSSIVLTPMSGTFIVTKGTENINNALLSYLGNLTHITEITGATIMARVLDVTDGDTIQVIQQCPPGQLCVTTPFNVRLHRISASELEFPAGRTAKAWLYEQIPPGTIVRLEVKGSDSYGRQIAQIFYPIDSKTSINDLAAKVGKSKVHDPTTESLSAKAKVQYVGGMANKYPAACTANVTLPSGVLELQAPVCNTINKNGSETWFGYSVKNVGSKNWTGWLGVILTDNDSKKQHQYTGDPAKSTVIAPGETKTLFAKFVVPQTMGNKISWEAVINSV